MNERQRGTAKTAVWIFSICLAIGVAAWRWSALVSILRKTVSVLMPVLLGLVFAYLLCPVMLWLEKPVGKLTDRKKPRPVLRRVLALAGTMLIVALIITGLIVAIVPELIASIKNLLVNIPEYLTSTGNWIQSRIAGLEHDQPQLYSVLISVWNSAQNSVSNLATQFEPKLDSIASGGADFIAAVTAGAYTIVRGSINFFIGMVFAIYLLFKKERYQAQARKVLYALFPTEKTHTFLRVGSHVSYNFMHFLSGKTLDSFIIGMLCFVGMTILRMPYAPLIAIIVGVTNIIPFFGPILGAVPSGLLVLLSEPGKVIPFVIFILLLQQFDGNFLGPKILGNSLGMPMFWTLFAITVGGGMFGFIGMVAFIPLFAALYAFLSDFLAEKLKKKGLPADTDSYTTDKIHFADLPDEEAEAPDSGAESAEPVTAGSTPVLRREEPHHDKTDKS
ncbi:MAG: AI-2E family transporter [Oscillospiraceae bacterium]|nr:AI-2E family transporter [Oscillospiraceae bacterium]